MNKKHKSKSRSAFWQLQLGDLCNMALLAR
jgi:hypothetical protein